MAGTIEDRITALVQPLIESMDVTLWGVRYRGGRDHAKLQIFIDRPQGVDVDLCGDVTAMLSPALDASDIIVPSYTLEVSSPGMDRILFTKEQAAAYVGQQVRAELKIPVQGRRKLSGVLSALAEDGTLTLEDKQSGAIKLAFENVALMRLVPDFSSNRKQPQ
ncbi:MAG: ribosome maturation factor RimP [Candidatus Anaerobiospirillum merdipullorum]|uniref:Ribosome maturation factor RimP n=1 Tax=Candidatus Anaerobiospirillum merdipullorum TaxID=2838450 RepID=A0A9E2KNY5_9GAMM|nr:ribosome maturation factor RimP [Candidatus Anaerobiospirillum merdipullorum]